VSEFVASLGAGGKQGRGGARVVAREGIGGETLGVAQRGGAGRDGAGVGEGASRGGEGKGVARGGIGGGGCLLMCTLL